MGANVGVEGLLGVLGVSTLDLLLLDLSSEGLFGEEVVDDLESTESLLVLGSPSPFLLGGERPASGFQSEQPSPFSFFFAFSLASLSPLVVLGESSSRFQFLMRTLAKGGGR